MVALVVLEATGVVGVSDSDVDSLTGETLRQASTTNARP